ncbi:MerC domain-containing protein [Flavobacterium sp. J27]|uniref:MerC domain-containing protein n=1 Tax=Flavobacterium sp. J27 TaxID=2060419 RepID=UPI0010320ABA|nr:MerC domain-containing protein [Flavobacterium sp. J27]
METSKNTTCTCHSSSCPNQKEVQKSPFKKTMQSIPSFILSILIAFFPKCPVCWAIYMSMLGSIGITEIPYMKWLLPVFIVFLAIHLGLLFRKIPSRGYGPFIISFIGFSIMIPSKLVFNLPEWITITGMFLVITGSLWNNFKMPYPKIMNNNLFYKE